MLDKIRVPTTKIPKEPKMIQVRSFFVALDIWIFIINTNLSEPTSFLPLYCKER